MTMTIKLAPDMEHKLRQRSQRLGQPASVLIREALASYLDTPGHAELSAVALGADLFGKHAGPADLAANRKRELAQIWADKQASRAGRG